MNIAARFYLLLLGIIVACTLSAQPISDKFGKIEDEYVRMKTYEADTSAEAVILFNKGTVTYEQAGQDLKLVHIYHKRIKILRPRGLEYADVSIPYFAYNRIEQVGNIRGMTHYVDDNGKIVRQKMEKNAIVDEDLDGRYHYKKFSLPNAKEGAIIEYTYKVYSEYLGDTRNWYFQGNLPTAYSRYVTYLPRDFDFRHLTLGEQYPINREVSNSRLQGYDLDAVITTYTAQNIPALIEEPHVTTMKNFYFRLELQLRGIHIPGVVSQNYLKSWDQLANQIREDGDFEGMLKKNGELKTTVSALLAKAGEDPHAQIAAIYHWVQHTINWDEKRSIYPNKKLQELLKDKTGNGASINMLLINMLQEAGFTAHPMLICTRSSGMPQEVFPTLRQFNHTIAYVLVGDESVQLDAIYSLTPYNMLPVQDLNQKGMVITHTGSKWENISPGYPYKTETHGFFKLAEDGSINGNIRSINHGYAGYSTRAALYKADDQESFIRSKMTTGFADIEFVSQEIENKKDISKPLVVKCEMETSDFVNAAGDFIYLQPMFNQAVKENPFKLEQRNYPVDFAFTLQNKYVLSLQIPEGYVVDESPESARIALPNRDGQFLYHISHMNNTVQILSEIKINRVVFDAQAYPFIKEFYEMIVAKHAEQIVLKKTN